MILAVDCRSFRKKPAGVPNFLINFINALSAAKPDWSIHLLSNEPFDQEVVQRLHPAGNIHQMISPTGFLPRVAILWYILKLPFLVKQLKSDLFYTPIPNLPLWLPHSVKKMITVHDMVYKLYPQTMSRMNWWINFLLHNRSIRNADFVWAVSTYTKRKIENCYSRRKCQDVMVGSSVDKLTFRPGELTDAQKLTLRKTYGIKDKGILFVGTLEPRKNLSYLISIMPDLVQHGFSLWVVGASGWGKQLSLQKNDSAVLRDKIRFLGFVPTTDLVGLYLLAEVYVSTSLNEGFGLPQLEAMCCGCPVVSPHNSAMIEIVEGAGETVKGWDRQVWIDTILRVATDRSPYINRGFERARQYDWSLVIANLLKFLDY